jgi:hypothetical protein
VGPGGGHAARGGAAGGGRRAAGGGRRAAGRIPSVALRGYGVDAFLMSFRLHDGGIHIVWIHRGPVLVMPM